MVLTHEHKVADVFGLDFPYANYKDALMNTIESLAGVPPVLTENPANSTISGQVDV